MQHFTSIFLLIITFAHPYTHTSFMYPVPLEPNSQISNFFLPTIYISKDIIRGGGGC